MNYRNGFSILFVLTTAFLWGCYHTGKAESYECSDNAADEGTDLKAALEEDASPDPAGSSASESDSEGPGDESGAASEGDTDSGGTDPELDPGRDPGEGSDGDSEEAEATDQETPSNACGYDGPLSRLDEESCLFSVPLNKLIDFKNVNIEINNRIIAYNAECRNGIGWFVGEYPNTVRLCDQLCADLREMADAELTLTEGCSGPFITVP